MKKAVLVVLAAFSFQINFAQDYTEAISKARFLIEQHKKQTQTPGVQVAVSINGSLVWSEAFGQSDLERETPATPTTKFRIASISKSLTSVALAKMVERDEIDLDKNVRHYLPDFPEKEFPITVRQLAASTSGIRHYTADDPTINSTHYPTVSASLERFQDDELLFEPGTDYLYSSFGWVLLSAVMEKASGNSFFEIMEKTWSELGMENTAFDYPNNQPENVTKFYIHDKKQGRVLAPEDNRSFMYAGGGYLSTAEDLVKLGNALLTKDYLSEETVDQLFESQQLADGSETHYGLGWETGESRLGTPIVYHGGSMSSARGHLVIYPDEKLVFAFLSNTGDHIFFNEREAQNIPEIFLHEKDKTDKQNQAQQEIAGEWKIKTTSLRDRRSRGKLSLRTDEDGILTGQLTFKRSRKKKSFPVILANTPSDTIHLIAVTPMFLDLYLSVEGDSLSGYWLHDFNVKGIPEPDDYWKARTFSAVKP
ncbi:serine hydrolase domain-containing protein [Halocola ammonii]